MTAPSPLVSKTVKTHCPSCNGDRVCVVHGRISNSESEEIASGRNSVEYGSDFSLLECRGCEGIFFEISSWNSEDVDHDYGPHGETLISQNYRKETFPKSDKSVRPNWLAKLRERDAQLGQILSETYAAFDADSFILAAVGLRTALDRATEILKIDPAVSFAEKLSELEKGGWIGATEREILDVIANAGSAAAHRAWAPKQDDAKKLLVAMEVFLYRAFIVGQDALDVRKSIPEKQKRRRSDSRRGISPA